TLHAMSYLLFFFHSSGDHRDLHSFPTRRSSDLREGEPRQHHVPGPVDRAAAALLLACEKTAVVADREEMQLRAQEVRQHQRHPRSEEHTSELQSRSDLVCRLLLEKKKKKKKRNK